jgi:hypothetical protein
MNSCNRCGSKIESVDAKFCSKCGNPITTTLEKAAPSTIDVKKVISPATKTSKDDQDRKAEIKTTDSYLKFIQKRLLILGAVILSVCIIILLNPFDKGNAKENGMKYLANRQWDKAIEYFQDLPLEEKNSPYSQMGLNYGLAAKAYSKGNLKSSFQYMEKALSVSGVGSGIGFDPPIYYDFAALKDSIRYHLDRDTLFLLLTQLKGAIKQSSDTSNFLIGRLCSLNNIGKLCSLLSPNGKTISNLCISLKKLNDIYPKYDDIMKDSINTIESELQKKKEALDILSIRRFAVRKSFGFDKGSGKAIYEALDLSTYHLAIVFAYPTEIPVELWARVNVTLAVKSIGEQPTIYQDEWGNRNTQYFPTFQTTNKEIVLSLMTEYQSLGTQLISIEGRRESEPARLLKNIQETQSELIKEFEVLFESNNS